VLKSGPENIVMSGPFYDVTIELDGRRYTGTWTIKQGGLICVSWGTEGVKTVELGRTRPELKAVTVLRQLVKSCQAQRAREQRALEAKHRRLSSNT
jgi:hypothetical protein